MSRTYRFWLQLIVSTLLMGMLLSHLDTGAALDILKRASLPGLITLFILYGMDRVLMAWKWDLLVQGTGRRVGLYNAVKIYYISSFIGFMLPLGGLGTDIVRFLQTRALGLSSSEMLSSIIVERVLGLIAALFMLAFSAGLLLLLLPGNPWSGVLFSIFISVSFGVVVALFIVFHRGVQEIIGRFLGLHNNRSYSGRLAKYVDALGAYVNIRSTLVLFLGLSLLEQFFPILVFIVAADMLDLDLRLLETLAVVPVVSFLQRLPISYAGLGIREGTYVGLLSLFGVDYTSALTISLALFVVYVLSLLPGGLWLLFEVRARREDQEQ